MNLRSVVVWVVLAILNGAVRNTVLTPRLGEFKGHISSTVILCAAILIVTWLTIGWVRPVNSSDALLIGGGWVLMTVAFEFLAGPLCLSFRLDHTVSRLRSICRSGLGSCSGDDGVCSPTHGSRAPRVHVVTMKPPTR
jgi:hypothetical protein